MISFGVSSASTTRPCPVPDTRNDDATSRNPVPSGCSSGCIHPRPAPSATRRQLHAAAGQNVPDHSWTHRRTFGKRVGGNSSRVRISYPPPVPHRARCRRAPPFAVGPCDVSQPQTHGLAIDLPARGRRVPGAGCRRGLSRRFQSHVPLRKT
ncbi:hypothetical protein STPH2_4009 [Streptomyces sp. KO7888]|nr:hypothetical protein [Streptomyces sp. KO7888]